MNLVSGTGTAIGTGSANTYKIIAQNGWGKTYAAGLASAYRDGVYSDWYLPSKDELNKLYLNSAAVGMGSYAYWSSSEYSAYNAWYQDFSSGHQADYSKGSGGLGGRVRPVRAF